MWLHVDAAVEIAKAVGVLSLSAAAAANSYRAINKALDQIKVDAAKAQTELLQQGQAQYRALVGMGEEFSKFLGFKNLQQLNERTGNPEVSVKLMLAHYRRMKKLVEFALNGKAKLPEEPTSDTSEPPIEALSDSPKPPAVKKRPIRRKTPPRRRVLRTRRR
jgi:hypothetical protein